MMTTSQEGTEMRHPVHHPVSTSGTPLSKKQLPVHREEQRASRRWYWIVGSCVVASLVVIAAIWYGNPQTFSQYAGRGTLKDTASEKKFFWQLAQPTTTPSDQEAVRVPTCKNGEFQGTRLAFVTPWNSNGYDVALGQTGKFDIIVPTWFEVFRR